MGRQFFVSGPTSISVGTGVAGALEFLGFSEGGISVEFNAEFDDVLCDIGGGKLPTDVIFQGMDAFIRAEVSNYDETVMTSLLARVFSGGSGSIPAGTMGSLMNAQSQSQRLLLMSPYSSLTAFSTMIPAYNFLSTYLVGSASVELGTKVKKWRLVWRAIPIWTVSAGLSSGTLWNESVTGAPVIS